MANRLINRILQLEQRQPATDIDWKSLGLTRERAIRVLTEGLRVMDADTAAAARMRDAVAELEAGHGEFA